MPEKLKHLSWRDLLVVALPSLLLIGLAFWATAQFIRPAPPSQLIMTSGGEGGAYQRFAARYREVLARYDVELVERPSAGSMENLARLRDPDFEVDAGFVQGGTARITEDDDLESLGDFYYEPMWVFVRAAAFGGRPPDSVTALRGRRIAIGNPGSGTHHLALEVLHAAGIDEKAAKLIADGGLGIAGRLAGGQLDAAFVVGPTQSALVWTLLHTPGVQLVSLAHAEAYVRRFPYLARLVLPRGAIDLVKDIPPRDVQLVSPMSTLMVREDTHPALVDLLMQAASEVHGGPGVFQRPGEFPRAGHSEFPLSPEAARYYKSGKPFLQRYLPFWAATLVDRLVVMLVPVFAILIPLFKFAPALYAWRVRSRIFARYGELKFLEAELEEAPGKHTRAEWMARLDEIASDVNRLPTPLNFSDMLYTLRGHIDLVRAAVLRLKPE